MEPKNLHPILAYLLEQNQELLQQAYQRTFNMNYPSGHERHNYDRIVLVPPYHKTRIICLHITITINTINTTTITIHTHQSVDHYNYLEIAVSKYQLAAPGSLQQLEHNFQQLLTLQGTTDPLPFHDLPGFTRYPRHP